MIQSVCLENSLPRRDCRDHRGVLRSHRTMDCGCRELGAWAGNEINGGDGRSYSDLYLTPLLSMTWKTRVLKTSSATTLISGWGCDGFSVHPHHLSPGKTIVDPEPWHS